MSDAEEPADVTPEESGARISSRSIGDILDWLRNHWNQIAVGLIVTVLGGTIVAVVAASLFSGRAGDEESIAVVTSQVAGVADGDVGLSGLQFDETETSAAFDQNGPWTIGETLVATGSSLRCGGNWYFRLDSRYASFSSKVGLSGDSAGTGFLNVVVNGATVELVELVSGEEKSLMVGLGGSANQLRLNYNYEPTTGGSCPARLVFWGDVFE